MKTEPLALFHALLVFLSVGGMLGAWNDLGRFILEIFLCIRPMKKGAERRIRQIIRIFLDLFFCLLAGISVIVLLFYFNEGKIRGFVLAALLVGFTFYRCTGGRLFGKVSTRLAKKTGRAVNRTAYYLSLPLYKLFLWGFHVISLPIKACRRKLSRYRMMRYDARCRQTLNEKSKKGFIDI